jgi:hypothetical protein
MAHGTKADVATQSNDERASKVSFRAEVLVQSARHYQPAHPIQIARLLLDVLAFPMSRSVCTNCRRTGRLLHGPTNLPVEFYACDSCGHVWTQVKNDRHATKKKVTQSVMNFRVVQRWDPDKGRQGTVQSEHKTVAEAFAALDSIATDMAQTGVASDAIELVVVDERGQVVPRPGTH